MILVERRRTRSGFAAFVLVMMTLAGTGCTSRPASPQALTNAPRCGAERDDFVAALHAYSDGATIAAPAADASGNANASLLNDATTEKAALAALAGSFAALSNCEGSAPESGYAAHAETALTVAARIDASLKSRLDQILGANPALAQRVRLSLLLSPPDDIPFAVVDDDEIYAEPNIDSSRIAALRKGQRVTAPEAPMGVHLDSDWLAIDLNDGSIGYVRRVALRALQTAPVRGALDPVARAAQIITQDLPQKEQEMWALLAASGALSNDGL